MNRTPIDWAKNPDGTQGYTWNPITGCLNGCEYCYARNLANGRLKPLYLANDQTTKEVYGIVSRQEFHKGLLDPFYPRFWPGRLAEVFPPRPEDKFRHFNKYRKPKGIFVCDMSDLFGIGIPEHWTYKVLEAIRCNEGDRFYLLTKQPQNLIKWSPFPDNCWVGVTATDENMFYNAMKYLWQIKAKVKFISAEPLLGRVSLTSHLEASGVGQVIIGAQTKPYKPPKIEWVQEIVMACYKADIPVFLKNNLWPLLKTKECLGGKYAPLPFGNEYGELRQEMPEGK